MRREYKVRVWRCIAFVGLFLCFLLGLGVGAYAQNANDILGKAAAAYENSNGISASFTMFTRSAGQNAGESFEGTIQMKGDKFTLVTPEALTWFNGTTQWTYVERNDEVNVTNPTGEELQFTNPALFPGAVETILCDFNHLDQYVSITAADYCCVMTRGHSYDTIVQAQLLATPACYIGVIGSRAKKAAVFRRLIEEYNINEQDLNRIISPIGLEIKAETPAEIAISITGQMIQVRADRKDTSK